MADKTRYDQKLARGKPDNVVEIDKYRSRKQRGFKTTREPKRQQNEEFEVEAHLYVEICSDGETRFGVVGADGNNAICLLEPIFILGQQLVRLTDN